MKLLGNKWGYIGLAVITALAVWQINTWTRVNPKVKKIKGLEEVIQVKSDSIELGLNIQNSLRDNLKNARLMVDTLRQEKTADSLNFVDQNKQQQFTIRTLVRENKNLKKGVRVDLVTLTYRKPLIGQEKLIDSTYQEGYKWGVE